MFDKLNTKLWLLLISLFCTGLMIMLFALDNSLGWGAYKIVICVLLSIWAFTIIPSFRRFYLENKDKSYAEWFKIGMFFDVSGSVFTLLFPPYNAVKYYFNIAYKNNE